jgi:glycosyltransferase involved in cell wall biosynthesis
MATQNDKLSFEQPDNELSRIADVERQKLFPKNDFSPKSDSYSATHPDALADGDNLGRGTAGFLDINNYKAGTRTDIEKRNEKIKIKVFSSMSIYKSEDKIFQPLFEALKKNEKFEYNPSVKKSFLADQFKSASFLTYPSTFAETFCITLLDALASGIEPIITDLGALKETSNNFGKIINLNQPNFDKIYAEKINESIKFKNNNFNSWCEKNFSQIEQVKKKYAYINIAKKWVEIIKKIIND